MTAPRSLEVEGRAIRLTHPERIVLPADPPITKGELVEYYRRVAPATLPHLRGRPLMLQRMTDGLGGSVFYQKEISPHFPAWVHRVVVPKRGGRVTHAICDNAATLVYLANQGLVTPHPWLSRADDPLRPDRMIFDLDPSSDRVADVRFAARAMRDVLVDAGLDPYLMATGSRGFHVIVAIRRDQRFPLVHAVAQELAEAAVRRAPDRLTIEFSKSRRGGRVFIDFHRNTYAQTAAPPYAVRPRPGAPVAVPLRWGELDSARPDGWTVRTVLARLDRGTDAWPGFGQRRRSLASARRWLQRGG